MLKTTLEAKIKDVLASHGFMPSVSDTFHGYHRVVIEGYRLSTFNAFSDFSLSWACTTAQINLGGSLSDVYRTQERLMLDILKNAGFHAYKGKWSSLTVCCDDQFHDKHQRDRAQARCKPTTLCSALIGNKHTIPSILQA